MRTRTATPSGQACPANRRWASAPAPTAWVARGESDEEGVPLGVDFVAVPGGKDLAQDLALVGEQGRIALAERLEQLGGAFDIGEQESDRAFGQVGKRDSGVRLVGHDLPPLGCMRSPRKVPARIRLLVQMVTAMRSVCVGLFIQQVEWDVNNLDKFHHLSHFLD